MVIDFWAAITYNNLYGKLCEAGTLDNRETMYGR